MGVDPGTIKAGYGVIDARGSEIRSMGFGVVRGGRDRDKYGERLERIFDGLTAIISAHHPEVLVLETVFFHKNVASAIRIGEGRGLAVLAAAKGGLALVELPPAVIKKAVTGRGDARKEQVAEMVRLILGLAEAPQPDDATDALACAIAGYHRVIAAGRLEQAADTVPEAERRSPLKGYPACRRRRRS
ncbi:MAG: crossover junction endodeoxyribonuclease RuvC [Planctomycetota bacterium]